jgi:predicted TIM-barrel fold metal-dependent hydrolase
VIDVTVLAATQNLDDARLALRQHGVAHGLLSVRTARHERANDIVFAAADDELLPVATLNPMQYLDWPSELERALRSGAKALRVYPDQQGWPVESEAFRAIVRRARNVPLLVPVRSFGDASRIARATEGHEQVVLVGAHYSQLGDCLAALERWPQLYLETSRLAHFRAIETITRSVGAERLLFGSGAPAQPVQAALNVVLTAHISDAEKRAILSANATRLFDLPERPFTLPLSTSSTGLIDVHGHLGALGLPTPILCRSEQVAVAREHGIALTVASSLFAIADDVSTGNAEAFAATSDALLAYVVVDPSDLEGSCQAMDEAYARPHVVGAKLHCSYAHTPTRSEGCIELLHAVADRGRPLLIHVDGPEWDSALLDVATAHADWKVIVAHGGPGTPVRAAAGLIERTGNVYVELCTSFPDLAVVREVVQRVGPERLLFGSDAPLLDPAYALGLYADANADLSRTTDTANKVFGW